MPRFGSRVESIAADQIDGVTGTFRLVENFLSQCGVPPEILSRANAHTGSGGRLGYLERVLDDLDANDPDRLLVVLNDLSNRLIGLSRIPQVAKLDSALQEVGFTIGEDGRVRPTEILREESEQAGDYLDELISENHAYLTVDTLKHHLHQHRILYAQGTAPGAATGEARQFVEQLLLDVAAAVASRLGHEPNLSQPWRVRQYLQDQGFFSKDEREKLIDGVYGYLSGVGSHPGIPDHSMARMAHVILLNLGVYLVEKLAAWMHARDSQ